MLATTRRFPTARKRSETGCRVAGRNDGVAAAHAARTKPRHATPPKVARVPATDATPPITGPSIAPKIAAPIALPINRPRELDGASATSHARPAVHEQELAKPCRKRAESSSQTLRAKPNSAVVTIIRPRPNSIVRLTPSHEAATPEGIPPASAPTAYAPASTPAPLFDSPSSST